MTSSNENDSSPAINPPVSPANTESSPSSNDGAPAQGREGGERRPRRTGTGKHPFNKKRPFNKDKPRREGGDTNGPRDGGGNQSAK